MTCVRGSEEVVICASPTEQSNLHSFLSRSRSRTLSTASSIMSGKHCSALCIVDVSDISALCIFDLYDLCVVYILDLSAISVLCIFRCIRELWGGLLLSVPSWGQFSDGSGTYWPSIQSMWTWAHVTGDAWSCGTNRQNDGTQKKQICQWIRWQQC